MKLIKKNKDMIKLVELANEQDGSARDNYLIAFVSAVAGITGTVADTENGIEESDGHGNVTVLTHLVAKISTRSSYRKKIIAWLEFYCDIKYNTQSLSFEYKINAGSKVKIDDSAWLVLTELPFWEKLPNIAPEFDFTKRMEKLTKSVDTLIADYISNVGELEETSRLVLVQKLLQGTELTLVEEDTETAEVEAEVEALAAVA